ncbi:hypothetical protein [Asticcacaulis sp.]|uniref:hypothetical protein n=1 Tax=Asticcacaulis sp. TaxID=1872648 RepID=UPI00262FEA04|nr:hypothetical protein [Asticcacaulis sp.]
MTSLWRPGAALIAVSALLAACSAEPSQPAAEETAQSAVSETPASVVSPSASAFDYAGRWTGVEGTYMTITPQSDTAYQVVIADLDGPKTYAGTLQADGLHIERNGTALVIVPGDGEATGMKWLAEKSDCLVVAANEGYCRD